MLVWYWYLMKGYCLMKGRGVLMGFAKMMMKLLHLQEA
jgi:hypothetical protein